MNRGEAVFKHRSVLISQVELARMAGIQALDEVRLGQLNKSINRGQRSRGDLALCVPEIRAREEGVIDSEQSATSHAPRRHTA